MVKIQQKGLGKGLSALISETYTHVQPAAGTTPEAAEASGAPLELALSAVSPGKFQPRTHFSEESLKELADSIRKNGVMQPIIVRPREKTTGGAAYEIVAGERRWRAAGIAGLKTIPVLVRALTDEQTLELALIENVQRADLSLLEEAQGYHRLVREFGHTQEELASIIGKSRSHIANMLRLLELPEPVKEMLDSGALTMGHARALLGAMDAPAIAKDIVKRNLSVRETEALVRDEGPSRLHTPRPRANKSGEPRAHRGAAQPSYGADKDPDIMALEEAVSAGLGMQVVITDRGQEGEVAITYTSLKQLDDLLKRLSGSGGF